MNQSIWFLWTVEPKYLVLANSWTIKFHSKHKLRKQPTLLNINFKTLNLYKTNWSKLCIREQWLIHNSFRWIDKWWPYMGFSFDCKEYPGTGPGLNYKRFITPLFLGNPWTTLYEIRNFVKMYISFNIKCRSNTDEKKMSSGKYYYYRRPIGDLDMPHRRPTCLIGDRHASLETVMPHWRSTCNIRDPSKTDLLGWRPTCLISNRHTYLIRNISELRLA